MTSLDAEKFECNRLEMTEAILGSTLEGELGFSSWFNRSSSLDESLVRGAWDFSFYFASPEVCRHLCKPEEKTCLEIGYGGGRLLNASRSFFKHSLGVDVHPFTKQVRESLLTQRNEEDFTLYSLNSTKLPFEDSCIDYAYSFIVIQHFYSHEIFHNYLRELQRVVVLGGLINLFFADLRWYPNRLSLKWIKGVFNGILEETAPPDHCSAYNTLWMSPRFVKDLMKQHNFKPLQMRRSFKRIPDGYPHVKGQQSGIIAVRI